jgi:hypothetical protein
MNAGKKEWWMLMMRPAYWSTKLALRIRMYLARTR